MLVVKEIQLSLSEAELEALYLALGRTCEDRDMFLLNNIRGKVKILVERLARGKNKGIVNG